MDDERLYSFAIPPPGDDTPSAPVELTGIKHVHPSRAHLSAVAPSTASNKRKHGTATATTGPAATRAAHSKKREAPTTAAHEDDDGGEAAAPDALPPLADDEEKPLSHKEKRLAKKRKLAAEAAGLDPDAPAPAPAAAATTSSGSTATTIGTTLVGNTPGRSAHGIWVGNMNYATHPRELLAWFAGHGLKEVVRINMPSGKRSHENNRGCVLSVSLLTTSRSPADVRHEPAGSRTSTSPLPRTNRRPSPSRSSTSTGASSSSRPRPTTAAGPHPHPPTTGNSPADSSSG